MEARILLALFLVTAVALPRAGQPTTEPGITGRVLSHDGSPVAGGRVTLRTSLTSHAEAAIGQDGQFRILPDGPGIAQLHIAVPGHTPYRATVSVPSSRAMALPDIELLEATYFQARFVSSDGEHLDPNVLRLRSFDIDGMSISDPVGHLQQRTERDGRITIGPLPAGRTLMAFDRPGFAQTRLRDVNVNGDQRVIDGGTIAIAKGASLHVDVIDAKGLAVPGHQVWIEDASQPSPLSFPVQRTNGEGRAVFDRLAAGRYRVFTQTVNRCGAQPLTVFRLAAVGGSGASRVRLVAGGRAAIRVTSAAGPLFGRAVAVSPDAPANPPWRPRFMAENAGRGISVPAIASPSCGGVTDNDGRLMVTPFPPGPATVRVRLFNSTWVTRITVPEGDGEIVVAVPEGLIAVRVINRATQSPVNARITWSANGNQVEAATTANGDALIEAAGDKGGTMTITANDFQPLEGAFTETPGTLQEIALAPTPSSRVAVTVVDERGDAATNAIVQLQPRSAADAPEFAGTDAKGAASFLNLPDGPLHFSAHAQGFKTTMIRVAEDQRAAITITLRR